MTIDCPITIGAPQKWTTAEGKSLTIGSNINTIISTLTIDGPGNTYVGDAIMGSGITKVNSGTLTAASINQGTLTIGSGAMDIIPAIPGGPQAGAITPVPEPSVFVLLGAALVMLCYGWAKKVK